MEETGLGDTVDKARLAEMAGHVMTMVGEIRQRIRIVDFWRNVQAQNELLGWLVVFLDDRNLVPYDRLEKVADRFLELARRNHTGLTA